MSSVLATLALAVLAQVSDTTKITFDFKDADVRDVLRAIGVQSGTNIVVDKDVQGKITVHLENVPVQEGLTMMLVANGFTLEKRENYYLVKKGEKERKKEILATRDRLTLDVKNVPIDELIRDISAQSRINFVTDQTVQGEINALLYDVPLERGLATLLSANGFILRKSGGIYEITKAGGQPGRRKGLSVTVDTAKYVTMNVSDADIGDIMDEIAGQAGLNLVRYGDVRGVVNAKLDRVPLDEALALVFQGTNYIYRKTNGIYLIGDKSLNSPAASALTSTELIPLKHIKADAVPTLLPPTIPAANIKVVKEQNAIMVFGTEDLIRQTRQFIESIDLVSPQIMIEAVVVEFSRSALREIGFSGGYVRPDTTRRLFPRLSLGVKGDDLDHVVQDLGDLLSLGNLGHLPSDFWLLIQAMENKGKARVRARPRVVTLNGNESSIDVGWVRYYRTTTGTPENPIYQLHSIDAGIRLKIVPWVSQAGEITTVIQTEVSNLKSLGPEGLPEISKRTVSTTIRLKDGETIAIGGLIQTSSMEAREGVPFLSSIPLLGMLFSKTTKTQEETELTIYITPRVYND